MLYDTQIKKAKPKAKAYKLADQFGLYLYCPPSGRKYWRYNYRYLGKYKTLLIGEYPSTTLIEARETHTDARKLLTTGLDPVTEKKRLELLKIAHSENSLKSVALQWAENQKEIWTEKHYNRTLSSLELDIFPPLGLRPVNEITSPEILQIIRKIEKRAPDQAKRTLQRTQSIFAYAVAAGMVEINPCVGLSKALKKIKKKNQRALTEKQLPNFMRKLEAIKYNPIAKLGLEFLIHTMSRTNEVRLAVWEEIDFDTNLWTIPGERMKMNRDHIVPLTGKTLSILEQMKPISGNYEYIFCGRNPKKPMNQNVFLNLIITLKYRDKTVTHGFRSTGSTILHEADFNSDWIELALAHSLATTNKIKASYNKAKHLAGRTKMLKWWTKYLESIKTNQKIIPIKRKA